MQIKHPNVLSIAGVDPSGGAGLLADVKTISSLGGYATGVVTAATASDLRVAGEISEDGVSAGVGVDNFSGFLADPASNVQPTTSNIVWYEE